MRTFSVKRCTNLEPKLYTLVLIGKDLLLEAKQGSFGFQECFKKTGLWFHNISIQIAPLLDTELARLVQNKSKERITPPETNSKRPEKWWVSNRNLLFYRGPPVSGNTEVSGRVPRNVGGWQSAYTLRDPLVFFVGHKKHHGSFKLKWWCQP